MCLPVDKEEVTFCIENIKKNEIEEVKEFQHTNGQIMTHEWLVQRKLATIELFHSNTQWKLAGRKAFNAVSF